MYSIFGSAWHMPSIVTIKIRYTKTFHTNSIMNKIRYAILMEHFLIRVCNYYYYSVIYVVHKERQNERRK